jgi:hypothetical protein
MLCGSGSLQLSPCTDRKPASAGIQPEDAVLFLFPPGSSLRCVGAGRDQSPARLPGIAAAGGPVIPVWGWPLVVCFTYTIALSMAEICSALPTSGGVYFWSGVLGGEYGPMFSWVAGWLQMLGQASGGARGTEHDLRSAWLPP